MSARFKDGLLLLLTGLVASAFSWAFLHLVGEAAIYLLMATLITILVSNHRDRRRARRGSSDQGTGK